MRTTVSARGRQVIGAAIAAASLSVGISACGSSAPTGTEADPAGLAPASSVLYIGAAVHPEGALRQNELSDLRALSHEREPLAKLLQSIAGSGPLGSVSFKREIEPWVGTEAGLFATSGYALAGVTEALGSALGSGGLSPEALLHAASSGLLAQKAAAAALVLDTRNLEQARAFVNRIAAKQGAQRILYRGVTYNASAQGTADAIVGKFAVFGNQAGVKQAIDTYSDGQSLSKSGPHALLVAKGPSGGLASIYLNPGTVRPGAAGETGKPSTGEPGQGARAGGVEAQAAGLLRALPGEPTQLRVTIVPQHDSFEIDANLFTTSGQAESKALAAASQAATLVSELPGNSWLAAGLGESGTHAAQYLTLLQAIVPIAAKSLLASFGGPAIEGLLAKLSAHPAAVQRLFSGWAGPAAAFAAGSQLLSIQAGLVIQSNSTAAARNAVGGLGALLASAGANVSHVSVPGAESALTVRIQGLPVALDIGAGAGKLAIGLGPESVQGALSPTSELSSSSLYSSASSSLSGGKPSILVDFPMALALIEGLGLSESPTIAPTIGYLRSLGTLAGSVQGLGDDVVQLHLVAGLQG